VRKDPAEVIAAAFDEAEAAGLEGNQRTGAATCIRHLNSKREFLHYDQALEAGWPMRSTAEEPHPFTFRSCFPWGMPFILSP
jgi:hypothetical protein